MNYLWVASRGMWRHENPTSLIEEAFGKIRRSNPGRLSKAVPFLNTVLRNMDQIAVDWARARARRDPKRYGQSIVSIDAKLDNGQGPIEIVDPEPDALRRYAARQALALLFQRCAEEGGLLLVKYMLLRFYEELEGKELMSALGVDARKFSNLTRAAHRIREIIRQEQSR